MLTQDILNRIRRDFSHEEVSLVEEILAQYKGKEPIRVARCILHISNGSYQKLKQHLDIAEKDYRDIIYFAEYLA